MLEVKASEIVNRIYYMHIYINTHICLLTFHIYTYQPYSTVPFNIPLTEPHPELSWVSATLKGSTIEEHKLGIY